MNNQYKNVELLAPAGSFDTLKAAINAGADAIYLGGSMFSARASASNFDNETMIKALDLAHLNDVKIYVAVNTLIKDQEMKECIDYISFLYENGADALIVQDIGLVKTLRDLKIDIPLHLSTQATVSSIDDIKALEEFDIERIVLPRETNIDEIKSIRDNSDIEIEAFIHGALCVSYSGKCLFSALNGGRSGNRGECAQACRKKYDLYVNDKLENSNSSRYVLSPKDLNTSYQIDKIINSGVTSLKIEGRMKRKEYVYSVVKAYRMIIDEYLKDGKITEKTVKKANYYLGKAFNRSFTQGYILNSKGKSIMNPVFQKPVGQDVAKVIDYNPKKKRLKIKLFEDVKKGDGLDIGESVGRIIKEDKTVTDSAKKGETVYLDFVRNIEKGRIIKRSFDQNYEENITREIETDKKMPVRAQITLKKGQNPLLKLSEKNIEIVATTDFVIQESINSPLADETIKKQISKTDTYPFEMQEIDIIKDPDIFMTVKSLNELRRKALEQLAEKKSGSFKRKKISYDFDSYVKNYFKEDENNDTISYFVKVDSKDHIDYLKNNINKIKYIITSDIDTYRFYREEFKNKTVYCLPEIVREEDIQKIKNTVSSDMKLMFSSYSFKDLKNSLIANYHMNIYNSFTHMYYNKSDIYTIASLENVFVNSDKYEFLKDYSKVVIPVTVYPQLMLTEFCPHKDEDGKCRYDFKCQLPYTKIKNDHGDEFLFERFLNCKTAITSSQPYRLKKTDIEDYVNQGYTNFYIELKTKSDQIKL